MQIYISPHCDDVCFSLAHTASELGGHLVNCFTRTNYVEADIVLPDAPGSRIAAVSALRRREDEAFAAAIGLNRHDLGLAEPPVMGLSPFDLRDMVSHQSQLSAGLLPCLLEILGQRPDVARARLYCPMGIGGHRDHMGALVSVRANFDILEKDCEVVLYEDLHYASDAGKRQRGIRMASEVFSGFDLTPCVHRFGAQAAARKLAAISGYASQLAGPPSLDRFTPASGVSGPHEIVWRVSRRPLVRHRGPASSA